MKLRTPKPRYNVLKPADPSNQAVAKDLDILHPAIKRTTKPSMSLSAMLSSFLLYKCRNRSNKHQDEFLAEE